MKEGQDRVKSDKARVLALGVLCLLVSSVAEAQQGFTCPEAQRVRVELPKWKARVLAASAGSPKLGQALAELRFGPDAAPLEGADFVVCEEPFKVAGVDLFQADLTEAAEKDRVVQVRMLGCEEDSSLKTDQLLIAVLRPLGGGAYCRLDRNELSLVQPASDTPCLGDAAKLPRVFSFVNLLDAKRQALAVKSQGGACEGVGRSAHYELAYWVSEGATLMKVFSADTYSASYRSPIPPVEERVGKVKLQGGYPKTIVLTEEVLCHPLDEEEKKALGDVPECKPSRKRTEYRWRDGHYLEQ